MIKFWDYDLNELKKTKEGRIKILERMINYGVYLNDKEKIPLFQVKKYWDKLKIDSGRRNFLKFIIWGR